MDIDWKRFFVAMLLCMVIMITWQTYYQKKHPPQQPGEPSPSVPSTKPETSPASRSPQPGQSPQITTSSVSGWALLPVEAIPAKEVLGSLDADTQGSHPLKAEITFDGSSAAPSQVLLSEFKYKITDEKTGYPLLMPCEDENGQPVVSFMLGKMKLSGRSEIFDLSYNCWQKKSVGKNDPSETITYVATVIDNKRKPVLEIEKQYRYAADDYELHFDLRFVNKTEQDLKVESLEIFGPVGILREDPRSERRKVIAAYRQLDGEFKVPNVPLTNILKNPEDGLLEKPKGANLQWFGAANKFFTAIIRPLPGTDKKKIDYLSKSSFNAQSLNTPEVKNQDNTITVKTTLAMVNNLPAAEERGFSFQIFMGPIDKEIFDKQYAGRHYEKVFAGRSCFCAFDALTFLIFKLMKGIHFIVGNYGIAIIVLVLMVRFVLHPISKKSQVNMMKMSKLGPKIEEIKTKYAGNKEEIQKRTMQVYKEHGIAGGMILGCLPMMLQMPIWIALYTAVDANVALRHEGLLPASWHWLTDLSAPDRLVPFSLFGVTKPYELPMLGGVDAFNLLPILLCVAMFLQTKYSPQSKMSQATNPQAAQQQKMMLYMMPAMMLLFFYTAPSGLNLYIMASTFGGLIEQHFIRKHLKQEQVQAEVGTVNSTAKIISKSAPKKKKPKPPIKYS